MKNSFIRTMVQGLNSKRSIEDWGEDDDECEKSSSYKQIKQN